MTPTRLRRTGSLLLTCALLMAAAPAAAAPVHAAAEGPSLLQAVQAWVVAWLLDVAPASNPAPAWKAVGSEPGVGGAQASAEDDPLAEPQLGPEADPSG